MAVSSMSSAASQAQNLCDALWAAGAGGFGKLPEGADDDDRPEEN